MQPYLIFAGAFLLTAGAPGADTMLIVSRTLVGGAASAIRYAIGITLAKLTAVTISFFGFSAMVHYFPQLFWVLKFLGAAFLISLAIRLWMQKPAAAIEKSNAASVLGGFVVGISNPQPIIFYTSVMPLMLDAQLAILLCIVASGFALVTAAYVSLASVAMKLIERADNRMLINRVMSCVFVALAIFIALR